MTTNRENKEFVETLLGSSALDSSIEWIAKNLNPSDVFDETDLETWALNNGFVKESK